METSEQAYVLVACAVIVGNLLTLALIAGWRGYAAGRRTPEGAPVWSYVALVGAGLFAALGVAGFVAGIILPTL